MESLAALVAFLFLITIFSGPFCLLLASKRVKKWSSNWIAVFIIRRAVVVALGVVGAYVATNFLFAEGLSVGRLIGFFGAITIIIAMKREFDGVKYISFDK